MAGRPRKVTKDKMAEVLAILTVGGSRGDAAAYCGLSLVNLNDASKWDPEFGEAMVKAEASGKVHHLKRIRAADAWQASAWFLERKYPAEFALRNRLDLGTNGDVGITVVIKEAKTE